MLKNIKHHWQRAVSGLLAVVMAAGMLPASAIAADASSPYAPTGSFELHIAGSTAWNGGDQPLTVCKTEGGATKVTTIPTATPFVLLEDKVGDRLKVGYVAEGGWTGSSLDGTGWADKENVLVNLPDVIPSIAYDRNASKQFNSRLTRFEYVVPGTYALAEQLALLQKEAMTSGETLVVRQSGQTVSISRAKGAPDQLHSYSLDGAVYQKYDTWTEYEAQDDVLSDLSYELPYSINRAYSADPSITLGKFCPQTVRRAPAIMTASEPTGGVGAYNPGSPGGSKPHTSDVDWSTDPERTFLRFTLIEFPEGVVKDIASNDYSTWHVVGTPLNVVWSKGRDGNTWSADKCRSGVTWYNSSAMQFNSQGANAAQLMASAIYSYDATADDNQYWVTTADEFQAAAGISDQEKEQMFHCNSGSWSSAWRDGDYTSMWGTDAESVTPGNLYKVYQANDAFIYLLGRLSSSGGSGGWSADEAMDRWSEYVHDASGNLRTKYRVIVETGGIFIDPDSHCRAYTLREAMAYSLYNSEGSGRYTLIYDQSSTLNNMARWMRQAKGSVTLYKYSSLDRRTPLEGVGFKITFADGKAVDNIGGKLSSNGIYYTDSEGQINISGVTGTLIFSEISTIPGYLIDENRKSQTIVVNPDDHQSVYFYNQPVGSILVKKMSSTTKEPLSDVVIRITRTDGTVVGTSNGEFRTDENGFIKVDVEPGSYIVQEVKSKSGFLLDDTPKVVEVKGPGIYNIELFNQPLGSLVIHKYSSLDRKTPLAGVQFKVTYAPGCVVDDENGKVSSNGIYYTGPDGTITIDGIVGTVVVSEQATIPGYTIDPATQSQTIVVNPDDVQHAYFYNTPKNVLIIEKYLETESGSQPLKGVTFLVTDSSGAVVGNSNGEFISGDDGRVVISGVEPGTTVNVREIKVPDGVVLDSVPKSIKISDDGANTLRFVNQKTGYLVVRKLDKVTKAPLSGVEFELTYADGSFVDDDYGHLSSKGRFVTNDAGEIRVPVVGTVVVKELTPCAGYVIDPATQIQTITVNPADTQTMVVYNEPLCSLTISKVDAVTGKPVPNTEFTLKDGDGNVLGRYTTGSDGTVTVTGLIPNSTVVVVESKVPSNYVLDSTPRTIIVRNGSNSVSTGTTSSGSNSGNGNGSTGGNNITVENMPKTTLTIEKYLETETGNVPLKGVTFLVTDSSGAVIGSSNGEFISDENGRIVIPNLEPGITVTAREIKVPDGVVLDSTPKNIKIEGGIGGQTLRFVNQVAGNLIINKVDGIDKHPLAGVTFKITYADGSNVDQDGGKTSSNGIYTTDSNGQIKISGITGTVNIMEIETIDGYYIDEKYRTQTVQVNPDDTQTVTVYNIPTQALVIQKFVTGSKDEPLAGVEFLITDSDSAVIGPNNGIYKTDQFGRITIKDLTPGTVITARETKSLDGYVLDSTPQSIEIKSGEVQTLTFYNAPIGGLELIKVSEADKTQRIKGVTFEIRKMDGALVDTVTTGDNGRVHVSLDAGDYYCVEIEAAEGFKVDSTPHYFTIQDNKTTTLTVTNKPFSGILIRKIDSVTKEGIYGVIFLLYDSNKNPIGQYSSDDKGYVYVDDLTTAGRYYLRELENEGYIVDTQLKTVYVTPGTTTEITWENTAITGQIQITKTSADYNSMNGWPAGTPIPGTEFEIYHYRTGNLVDTIRTDKNGVAVSKPLPLGRYKVVESKAADFYGLDKTPIEVEIEHAGQIVKTAMTNKALYTNVSIKKTGFVEVMPGQQIRYDFSGIANNSTTALTSFYWRDTLPTQAVRLDKIVTGTYNVQGNYKIVYKTNLNGEYRTMYDNLSTQQNYVLDASPAALGLASNECVTEFMVSFGVVPANFRQVESPKVYCNVVSWITGGTQFVNQADVGGVHNGQWIMATSRWVTKVYKPSTPLPRTGY